MGQLQAAQRQWLWGQYQRCLHSIGPIAADFDTVALLADGLRGNPEARRKICPVPQFFRNCLANDRAERREGVISFTMECWGGPLINQPITLVRYAP